MRAQLALLGALATVLALLTGAPASGAAPSGAAASDPPPKAVSSDDVAAADHAVARAASVLRDSRAQLGAARADQRRADAALAASRARATAAVGAARSAATAAAAAVAARVAAQASYDTARREVGDLARAVYMQGPYSELDAVLTATDPGDFADRLAAVESLGRSYNQVLERLVVARADLALREAAAQAAAQRSQAQAAAAQRSAAAAATAQRTAAAATARVATLVAARANALTVARRNRTTVAEQYRRYRAYQREIAAQTRAAAGSGAPSASGSLLWPIPGAGISGGVGWRVHPVYGYRSCHTGVDIRGWTGTPIHAAAAGVVTLVVDEGAYGLHTIISHAGGLATMYAHQSRTIVHPGEHVSAGQVIGYVGATGWLTGPHLHFEVHVGGVPYDPMGWFGGGPKHPVPCYSG